MYTSELAHRNDDIWSYRVGNLDCDVTNCCWVNLFQFGRFDKAEMKLYGGLTDSLYSYTFLQYKLKNSQAIGKSPQKKSSSLLDTPQDLSDPWYELVFLCQCEGSIQTGKYVCAYYACLHVLISEVQKKQPALQ